MGGKLLVWALFLFHLRKNDVSKKPQVHLVQVCPQYLVPHRRSDCDTLAEHHFTATKIPTANLGLIQTTLLKGVDLVKHPWEEVGPALFDRMEQALRSALAGVDVRIRRKAPEEILVLHITDDGELDLLSTKTHTSHTTPAAFDALMKAPLSTMSKYLGQYCRGLVVHQADRQDLGGRMFRITANLNETMANALYYKLSINTPTVVHMNLGTSFRLAFEMDTLVERPVLRVTSQERIGGEWVSNLTRAFQRPQIDPNNIGAVVDFFLSHLVGGN